MASSGEHRSETPAAPDEPELPLLAEPAEGVPDPLGTAADRVTGPGRSDTNLHVKGGGAVPPPDAQVKGERLRVLSWNNGGCNPLILGSRRLIIEFHIEVEHDIGEYSLEFMLSVESPRTSRREMSDIFSGKRGISHQAWRPRPKAM